MNGDPASGSEALATRSSAETLASWDGLQLVRRDDVCTLRLISPETSNCFTAKLHVDFVAALDMLMTNDARCAVIASTGRVFSGGADFEFMRLTHEAGPTQDEHLELGRQLLSGLLALPMPVVAAVQGPAVGVGASIVLACDAVVAARTAWLSDPHVIIGLVAGDGGCLLWPEAVGMPRARRYLLTGDRLPAEQAWQFGLVTDLVNEPDDALPEAQAIAARIAALPPLGVRGTKRALANVTRARAAEVNDLALELERTALRSEDFLEAVNALEARRTGVYHGR